MANEIGKIYVADDGEPEIFFKHGFTSLPRQDQLAILSKLIDQVDGLGEYLGRHENDGALGQFFRSLQMDEKAWRKQRGIRI